MGHYQLIVLVLHGTGGCIVDVLRTKVVNGRYEFIFTISVMPSQLVTLFTWWEKWARGEPPLNPLWEHCYDEKSGSGLCFALIKGACGTSEQFVP